MVSTPTPRSHPEPPLSLTPGEGCGNRFLLVRESAVAACGRTAAELARLVCNEQVDGLLLLGPEGSGEHALRIINRDGSDGGCCLNGCRVAARFLGGESGRLAMAGASIPWTTTAAGIALRLPLSAADLTVEAWRPTGLGHDLPALGIVRYWNPHVVVALRAAQSLLGVEAPFADFPLAALAARLREDQSRFPDGVNVGLRHRLADDAWLLRVEERGVGETAACGSGAVAAAAVAWSEGGSHRQRLRMGGGELLIQRLDEAQVELVGEASVAPCLTLEQLLSEDSKAL